MRLRIIILVLFSFCFAGGIYAQERPELFSKVEKALREKEPAWKIEEVILGDTSDPVGQRIFFKSRRGRTSIDIDIWSREKDARDVFTAESYAIDNAAAFVSESLGRKIDDRTIKSSVPKLGDENHVWSYRGYPRQVIIKFRKGNITVRVDATSEAVAKRFAQHVFEQMAAG